MYPRMERIDFQIVKATYHKNAKCAGCGKRLRRQKTFSQTINPWNKMPDGSIKNETDIRRELMQTAAEWEAKPEWCAACRSGGGTDA